MSERGLWGADWLMETSGLDPRQVDDEPSFSPVSEPLPASLSEPGTPVAGPDAAERHWARIEIAELWHLDVDTIRRIFQDEARVLLIPKRIGNGRNRPSF
jgi:hypothetical protein